MRHLILTILFILLATPAFAGISSSGGNSTLWFCHDDGIISEIDSALASFSNDQAQASPHALAAMVLRDQSVITAGDGVADTGFCGVLPIGKSEWRVEVKNASAGAFRDGVNAQLGYNDSDPSDGLDDATGLDPNAYLDRGLKFGLRAFVLRQRNINNPPPVAPGDFDVE